LRCQCVRNEYLFADTYSLRRNRQCYVFASEYQFVYISSCINLPIFCISSFYESILVHAHTQTESKRNSQRNLTRPKAKSTPSLPTSKRKSKEAYISRKEPYIRAKDFYISTKEPYICTKSPKSPKKSPVYPLKSPTSPQKSPISLQKGPISAQRSAISSKKSPIYPHNRASTSLQKNPVYAKRVCAAMH